MLKRGRDLDLDARVDLLVCGWVALDPDSGAHLRRSAGRRRAGRPARYTLHVPNQDRAIHFTAPSDDEAVVKGNRALALLAATPPAPAP